MQSGLEIAYLQEIELQCSLIARAASRLDRESEAADRDEIEIWTLVQTILASAANLASVLWGSHPDERRWLRRSLHLDESSSLEVCPRVIAATPFSSRIEEWDATRVDNGFVGFRGRQIGDPDDPPSSHEWFQRFDATTGVLDLWGHRLDLAAIVREVHRIQPLARASGQAG